MNIFAYIAQVLDATVRAGGRPKEIHLNDFAWMALNSSPEFRTQVEVSHQTRTLKFQGLPILLSPKQLTDVAVLTHGKDDKDGD
jgi:hypothetical protein